MSGGLTAPKASPERASELHESLQEIRQRVRQAIASSAPVDRQPTLVAVSKYKPASDVLACFELGQIDFGENYVQELVDKAEQLPTEIRWHFIGTLQSNKAKILASIPNLYAVQTVTSTKAATALNKALPAERTSPLNVLVQVNTSGEDNKSGLPPLPSDATEPDLVQLARHIIVQCPRLHLQGLMTIGSLAESLSSTEKPNEDFERLVRTRDLLQEALVQAGFSTDGDRWGEGGKLLLSMGMSSDFEAALNSGSDIVRVGTGIFGTRLQKEEIKSV
ncbi:hypothetical protein POSPLADRAFT_1156365 [Postia placenta MAD-698-R-SB12]|uniref:Pyridoxal phosphate homeostasis protein n=1 Tax=Postia placenta MAD-698-R-SB12 TaxID=670580 RepID=A0A1X6MNI8_9APHY|nr:hypothetical protein POSPLADRAFT_1156365 [Postia placenta MAD-698-R-SB12]OSX57663.1 hypothetical protein POSPLADRAFT_1156365 [Postia placenta MAD-698-R-SB12]